ncbi:MAG: hypothetical protein O6945_16110 [Gammaproteobacteria bacterium]|nr:hypothetical protein [Gammaproteobacteria bacterium]
MQRSMLAELLTGLGRLGMTLFTEIIGRSTRNIARRQGVGVNWSTDTGNGIFSA